MRWRYEFSWILFAVANAAIAILTGRGWLQRGLIFLVQTLPVTLWALHRIRVSKRVR
jgi:hypothetical protein